MVIGFFIGFFAIYFLIGAFFGIAYFIYDKAYGKPKSIGERLLDFGLAVPLWPVLAGWVLDRLRKRTSWYKKQQFKKRLTVVVSEENETEESFANRCKRL